MKQRSFIFCPFGVFFSFFRIGTLMFSSILFVKSLVIIKIDNIVNNHEMENKNNNTKKLRCSSTPTSVS